MPTTSQQIPQRGLSGFELAKIIMKDVEAILAKDGMYTGHIMYSNVAYEVRVSLHANIAGLPEHITTVLSREASKSQVIADPNLAALDAPPLGTDPADTMLGDEGGTIVTATETAHKISSPNGARIGIGLPLPTGKMDPETGKERTITFEGDMPDQAAIGNPSETTDKSEDQRNKWNEQSKRKGKGRNKDPQKVLDDIIKQKAKELAEKGKA